MLHTSLIAFPAPPMITGDTMTREDIMRMNEYFANVKRAIIEAFDSQYADMEKGRFRYRTFANKPTTSDMDNGEIAIYLSGGSAFAAFNVSGTIRYAALT